MLLALSLVLAAGKVWTFWIGVVLAIGALFTVLALVLGYVLKVQAPQYPKRDHPGS